MVVRIEFVIIPSILVFIAILIPFFMILKKKRKERWINDYKNSFCEYFTEERSIKETLEQLLNRYQDDRKISNALMAALSYLEWSVIRDYQTAFTYLEDIFQDEEVMKIHEASIEVIKQQRIYRIPVKKEEIKKC